MGRLTFINRKGDTGETWEPGDAGSTEKAREAFELAIRKGAFAAEVVDGSYEQLRAFKPEATEILLIPQIRGGL
jgi:hypothetical protein